MFMSPQSLPPEGAAEFLMEPPPHAPSASADAITSAVSAAGVRLSLMWLSPSLVGSREALDAKSTEGAEETPARLGGPCGPPRAVRGDPVEHDPEQHDRDPGGETATDVAGVPEAVDDVEAQGARPRQAADDDQGEHVQESLVGGEQQRAARHRQLHLHDHLPRARARRLSGLDG